MYIPTVAGQIYHATGAANANGSSAPRERGMENVLAGPLAVRVLTGGSDAFTTAAVVGTPKCGGAPGSDWSARTMCWALSAAVAFMCAPG
jgi:hypothetical protein